MGISVRYSYVRTKGGKAGSFGKAQGLAPGVVKCRLWLMVTKKVGNYFVDLKEFKKFWQSWRIGDYFAGDGTDNKEVLIHEVNYHPVSNEPIHADFYVIERAKR